ncbi:hypothetical protein [Nonomuraea sp. NPDC049309]|uniref:hypothetical protein n=1 Tax=Nonomuraea sp. NPDC049309 TaxID=3364350 RepID=UPI0037174C43
MPGVTWSFTRRAAALDRDAPAALLLDEPRERLTVGRLVQGGQARPGRQRAHERGIL